MQDKQYNKTWTGNEAKTTTKETERTSEIT